MAQKLAVYPDLILIFNKKINSTILVFDSRNTAIQQQKK